MGLLWEAELSGFNFTGSFPKGLLLTSLFVRHLSLTQDGEVPGHQSGGGDGVNAPIADQPEDR